MAVSAIQNNNHKTKGTSILGAALVGGISGYALKYALPITPQERDERFSAELDKNNKLAKAAKNREIKEIKKSAQKSQAEDTFVKMFDGKELRHENVIKLEEPLKSQVMDVIKRINDRAREVKIQGREMLNAFTKKIRPAGIFIVAGMGIAVTYAFIDNVIKRMKDAPKGS